jgi:hypothetical protein
MHQNSRLTGNYKVCTKITGGYFELPRLVPRARQYATPASSTSSETIPAISSARPRGLAPPVAPLVGPLSKASNVTCTTLLKTYLPAAFSLTLL